MGLFNLSLLLKWKWRFLVDSNVVWFNLLRFKYGPFGVDLSGKIRSSSHVSVWRSNIVAFDSGNGLILLPF